MTQHFQSALTHAINTKRKSSSLPGDNREALPEISKEDLNDHSFILGSNEFGDEQACVRARKLIGRPRASYAAQELNVLDSIKSVRLDRSGHLPVYYGRCDKPVQADSICHFAHNFQPTSRNCQKTFGKERYRSFVSSSLRRVQYDHLEYDRFMPPPDLLDGPIVYKSGKPFGETKSRKRSGDVPLWHHPVCDNGPRFIG